MRCQRCSHENPEGSRFCGECGTPFNPACPRCQTPNPPENRFCHGCGAPFTSSGTPTSARFASPQTYTPAHLAEKILTNRTALEGEHKPVTVLFCDLCNSTPITERIGPEAMRDLLNRFFELALGEVHRYEGTITQFLGDGFMALFGAPVAHEDHARRAVLAALGIQRAVVARGPELGQPPHPVEVAVHMGLHTGRVVVGRIGDNLRMDYTAIGDTTNVAARPQHLAEPGVILVSDATRRAARGWGQFELRGPVQLKGKSVPVVAYSAVGAGPQHAPLERPGERQLSPFVGRARELATLQDLRAQAARGHCGIAGDDASSTPDQLPRRHSTEAVEPRGGTATGCALQTDHLIAAASAAVGILRPVITRQTEA